MNLQNNRRPPGPFKVLAGENLTGKEGLRVVLTHDTGIPEVILPNDVADIADYVLIEGGADGSYVTVEPLVPGTPVRLRLKGTCNAGAELTLGAIDGTDDGKVRTLPATADIYYVSVRAEEKGVDGQMVLCRVINNARLVTVS
jgi:hypothetical protein